MQKRLLTCFVYALLLLSAGACRQDNASEGEPALTAVKVEATRVEPSSFTRSISSMANLLPFEQVELKAPVAGNVMAIYFEEGQQVKKGARLIRIDDRHWRAQLQGLEAQLSSATSEFERNQQLIEREGISQETLEQAEAAVRELEAQIRELRVNIQLANVRAPMSGVVGMRDFSLGDYLTQGQTITQLVQKDKLRVDFAVPAEYAAQLEEGQEVKVIASASGDTAVAEIYAINPAINLNSRQIQLRALLENGEGSFIPGDFAEIQLEVTEEDEALLIPAEAVVPEVDSHVVYKLKNGRAVKQEVVPGVRTESEIQIMEGLVAGDTVLLTGLMQIEDGQQVQVDTLKRKAL